MAEDVTGKKYPFTNEDGSLTEEYRDGVDALNQHDKKEWERIGKIAEDLVSPVKKSPQKSTIIDLS